MEIHPIAQKKKENTKLKFSDKVSNLNVNSKHRNSTLKSKPCINKNILTFRDLLPVFTDLKGTGSDTLIQKQSAPFFRVTDTHLNSIVTKLQLKWCKQENSGLGKMPQTLK